MLEPKYHRARESLRHKIEAGELPPGARVPSGRELSRLLKASDITVRRAMQDLVRDGLVVRRRGKGTFVADSNHPPLIPGRHLRLGLLWPYSVLPRLFAHYRFLGDQVQGMLEGLGLDGITADWHDSHPSTRATWNSIERDVTLEAIGESTTEFVRHPPLEEIRQRRFDGLIALNIIDETWLEELLGINLPLVLCDFPCERFDDRIDQAYLDPSAAYRRAVRRYIEEGLRNIHFVGLTIPEPPPDGRPQSKPGPERIEPDTYARLNAYRQALDENGISPRPEWIHYAGSERRSHERLGERLAALSASERPEAVICHSANQAHLFIEMFSIRGLRLRGAGADDGQYRGPAHPLNADGKALGSAAAQLLLWRLKEPKRPCLRVGVSMSPGNLKRDIQVDLNPV